MDHLVKNKLKFAKFLVLIFILILLFAFFPKNDIASADLPSSYIDQVSSSEKDWYFGENYLNINEIKSFVNTWFDNENFSFNGLEENPIIIAVIDSGINYEHNIFTGDQDLTSGDYINDVLYRDSFGNLISKNTVDGDSVLDDSKDKHGTHVSGIIATLIHELNLEKYIKILPIKAGEVKTDGTHFNIDDYKEAIDFALNSNASVINMSFSSTNSSFGSYIDNEKAKKAIFVAAAGNNSTISSLKKYYPAAGKNVIGIMNFMQNNDNISLKPSSNYGEAYDLCAPGTSIFSADGETLMSYKSLDGTSMAAPFVSFGAALTILKYKALENSTKTSKSVSEIKEIILGSSIKLIQNKYKVYDLKSSIIDPNEVFSSIKINSGSLKQYFNKIEELTLSLNIFPLYLGNEGNYKWYVNNELKSEESIFTFIPDNIVKNNEIKCIWKSFDNKFSTESIQTLYIEYQTINIINIKDTEIVSTTNDNSITFDINGIESINPDEYNSILWYINNTCVGAGKVLNYSFYEIGNYNICAKINGYYTDYYTIEIKEENINNNINKNLDKNLICSIVFGGLLGIIYLSILIYSIKKR